jgi:hypothetical protein
MSVDSWPDPERPGVPLNPEKDGWHWLKESGDDPTPYYWCPGFNNWHLRGDDDYGGGWKTPEFTSRYYSYVGPCLTPVEVFEFASSVAMRERERCARIASIFGQGKAGIEASKIIEKEIMNNDR